MYIYMVRMDRDGRSLSNQNVGCEQYNLFSVNKTAVFPDTIVVSSLSADLQ